MCFGRDSPSWKRRTASALLCSKRVALFGKFTALSHRPRTRVAVQARVRVRAYGPSPRCTNCAAFSWSLSSHGRLGLCTHGAVADSGHVSAAAFRSHPALCAKARHPLLQLRAGAPSPRRVHGVSHRHVRRRLHVCSGPVVNVPCTISHPIARWPTLHARSQRPHVGSKQCLLFCASRVRQLTASRCCNMQGNTAAAAAVQHNIASERLAHAAPPCAHSVSACRRTACTRASSSAMA